MSLDRRVGVLEGGVDDVLDSRLDALIDSLKARVDDVLGVDAGLFWSCFGSVPDWVADGVADLLTPGQKDAINRVLSDARFRAIAHQLVVAARRRWPSDKTLADDMFVIPAGGGDGL